MSRSHLLHFQVYKRHRTESWLYQQSRRTMRRNRDDRYGREYRVWFYRGLHNFQRRESFFPSGDIRRWLVCVAVRCRHSELIAMFR